MSNTHRERMMGPQKKVAKRTLKIVDGVVDKNLESTGHPCWTVLEEASMEP